MYQQDHLSQLQAVTASRGLSRGGLFTNKQTIEPNCAQGGYDLFNVEKDGQELVIRNASTSTRVCRVRIKGKPTVDEVITRGSTRSFKKDPLAAYQVDCNRGTEYMGRLSKVPM